MPSRTGGDSNVKAAGAGIENDLSHLRRVGGKSEFGGVRDIKCGDVCRSVRHRVRRPICGRVPIAAGGIEIPGRALGTSRIPCADGEHPAARKQEEERFHDEGSYRESLWKRS